MDLSIGEFQEVGNVVKQFASDDATVVVGTVIDPDMANQIRVTVVATGLGKPVVARARRSRELQSRSGAWRRALHHAGGAARRRRWRRPTTRMLDKPTVQRQRAVGDGLRAECGFGGSAGYSGVSAAAGRLMSRLATIQAWPRRAAVGAAVIRVDGALVLSAFGPVSWLTRWLGYRRVVPLGSQVSVPT